MKLLLDRATLKARPELISHFLRLTSEDAAFLRESYPQFDAWLHCKVIPGIFAGERTIVAETRDRVAVALLIVKHTASEKKLCTLRVRPHYESKGLGVRLFEEAFDLLNTRHPLLSVSEKAMPKFSRVFEYFGFALEGAYKGLYLPKVNELSYNGLLEHHEAQERHACRAGLHTADVASFEAASERLAARNSYSRVIATTPLHAAN
jgi:GNAT superfamily N-acetyltransferase